MKLLLTILLGLFTFTSACAQAWPRNPQTGKVELRGALPWPASVKTEAQRRLLVQQWYLAKLTDSTLTEVEAQAATNKTNGLLTYAGLPKVTGMQEGKGDNGYLLSYTVSLSALPRGITYVISALSVSKVSEEELTPIEQVLAGPSNKQAALTVLRKRLAVALAGW